MMRLNSDEISGPDLLARRETDGVALEYLFGHCLGRIDDGGGGQEIGGIGGFLELLMKRSGLSAQVRHAIGSMRQWKDIGGRSRHTGGPEERDAPPGRQTGQPSL